MSDESIDASGFIDAPIDLVRELVERYVANGCDRGAMSQIVALVLSVLVIFFNWVTDLLYRVIDPRIGEVN